MSNACHWLIVPRIGVMSMGVRTVLMVCSVVVLVEEGRCSIRIGACCICNHGGFIMSMCSRTMFMVSLPSGMAMGLVRAAGSQTTNKQNERNFYK